MTREDFEGWLADPVTRWVMRGVERAAEAERAEWMRVSWEGGSGDQRKLDELRDRASALTELKDNTFENWRDWNGEPDDDDE